MSCGQPVLPPDGHEFETWYHVITSMVKFITASTTLVNSISKNRGYLQANPEKVQDAKINSSTNTTENPNSASIGETKKPDPMAICCKKSKENMMIPNERSFDSCYIDEYSDSEQTINSENLQENFEKTHQHESEQVVSAAAAGSRGGGNKPKPINASETTRTKRNTLYHLKERLVEINNIKQCPKVIRQIPKEESKSVNLKGLKTQLQNITKPIVKKQPTDYLNSKLTSKPNEGTTKLVKPAKVESRSKNRRPQEANVSEHNSFAEVLMETKKSVVINFPQTVSNTKNNTQTPKRDIQSRNAIKNFKQLEDNELTKQQIVCQTKLSRMGYSRKVLSGIPVRKQARATTDPTERHHKLQVTLKDASLHSRIPRASVHHS